jgi:ABC-type microcin C transport system duplicated ATPase subunit YejF
LSVENLGISLPAAGRTLAEGISFEMEKGDRLGIIGESGSGKSITALALLGLLPATMRAAGRVALAGVEVIGSGEKELSRIRGAKAAMIFQEPLSALDPLMKVGRQIAGPLRLHRGLAGQAARREVRALLERVQLPGPERIAASFPHELSGGQRQRVAIAMALACRPALLIADEPTTALDVTVQAEVLALLDGLVTEEGMALLFITHDLPVISRVARRLLVMQDGRIVEDNTTEKVLTSPEHPAVRRLIEAARRVTNVPYVGQKAGA